MTQSSRSPVIALGARLALAASTVLAGVVFPSAAALAAGQQIEGVWSFNGGKVAIERQADGSLTGTVVEPTRFAECSHPIGEPMWTNMQLQSDGSYWGYHAWFFEDSGCVLNPELGKTAWRVLQTSGASYFLRACLSSPGTTQPTISAGGQAGAVTYGCVDSALVAGPPGALSVAGFTRAVSLPPTHKCLSRRSFQIHLRDPRNDPLKEIDIVLAARRLAVVRHGDVFASTINLRGLPKGAFTVRIHLTTVLGHRLSASRTYHTCAARRSLAPSDKRRK